MSTLPLIVGYGGFSSAGRSSFDHAYKRTILDAISKDQADQTLLGLATMMNLVKEEKDQFIDTQGNTYSDNEVIEHFKHDILNNTLIRKVETERLHDILLPDSDVNVAGQLPSGFQPSKYYKAKQHPLGLQLTVLAASDAIMSMGIPWQDIMSSAEPDQVSVYAGSLMGQLDYEGFGNMMQAHLKNKKTRAKNLPLGLNSMPADFINAYVIGSFGKTGGANGACATFLYNLEKAVQDIRSGVSKVAIVGNSEAPLVPEIVEGYAAMGALATDTKLGQTSDERQIDYRKASQPFGDNSGFILAESAQYIVLMEDELALNLGAIIHGSIGDVFIAADGYKSSISAPGPGNYLTMAKAVSSAKQHLGEELVRTKSFVQAHGSSTPNNRVTESKLLSDVAEHSKIEHWPVTAIKCSVGHSLSPASADQLIHSLGVFNHGVLPGIKTTKKIADDVTAKNLDIRLEDKAGEFDIAFINSKGFGGNNASAYALSPTATLSILSKRFGKAVIDESLTKQEKTKATAERYDTQAIKGNLAAMYSPMTNSDEEVSFDKDQLVIGDRVFNIGS